MYLKFTLKYLKFKAIDWDQNMANVLGHSGFDNQEGSSGLSFESIDVYAIFELHIYNHSQIKDNISYSYDTNIYQRSIT